MSSHVAIRRGAIPAAFAQPDERADFIRKTYIHLGLAILAFVGISTLLVKSPLAEPMVALMLGGRFNWLVVLGLFMVVGWVANYWAQSSQSKGMQYAGLILYVVAESVLFLPLLYIAAYYTDKSVLPTAAILTLTIFGGLTATVFITKKDFSWMGRGLMLFGFAAMGLIVVSIVVGFSLGTWFSVAMIALASGYILFYTSRVMKHYPIGSHVAASLALFAAVALLFWYILRLLMALNRR